MDLQWLICCAVLAVTIRAVCSSPVASAKNIGKSRANTIEDLFYIDESEEKTLDEETLNTAIIEKLKARILHALKLKAPPKSHVPVTPLQKLHLKNDVWRNSGSLILKEHVRQHLKTEFLSSELIPNTCFDQIGLQCLRFQIHIPGHLSIENGLSELWLYKKSGATEFKFTQILDIPGYSELKKELFLITNQSESAGWIRFDASTLLAKLSTNVLDIEIVSESSNIPIEFGKDNNPFLVFLSKAPKGRSKRGIVTECSKGTTKCCMMQQYLSFHEIGWEDWVVHPEGFFANICKGSCNNLALAKTQHAQVMMRIISRKSVNNFEGSVHCTPKSYKSLPIAYRDNDGLKKISSLQDVSVTECACS